MAAQKQHVESITKRKIDWVEDAGNFCAFCAITNESVDITGDIDHIANNFHENFDTVFQDLGSLASVFGYHFDKL